MKRSAVFSLAVPSQKFFSWWSSTVITAQLKNIFHSFAASCKLCDPLQQLPVPRGRKHGTDKTDIAVHSQWIRFLQRRGRC